MVYVKKTTGTRNIDQYRKLVLMRTLSKPHRHQSKDKSTENKKFNNLQKGRYNDSLFFENLILVVTTISYMKWLSWLVNLYMQRNALRPLIMWNLWTTRKRTTKSDKNWKLCESGIAAVRNKHPQTLNFFHCTFCILQFDVPWMW